MNHDGTLRREYTRGVYSTAGIKTVVDALRFEVPTVRIGMRRVRNMMELDVYGKRGTLTIIDEEPERDIT